MRTFPLRTIVIAFGVALLLIALLGWCHSQESARNARKEAGIAGATGKALDGVAAQTPVIRQEQKEKEDAVDRIEGADQPLPPGFGADLERVRRGTQPRNPG